MKEYIIAGNWKMFKTVEESLHFYKELQKKLESCDEFDREKVEVLIFPSYISLYQVKDSSTIIKTGSQNMHFEEKGAFTGEVSPLMLQNVVDYVLIGHSERRTIFKEDDKLVNTKLKTALSFQFNPVLCIGESLQERENGFTFSKISEQLEKDLTGLNSADINKIVLAYEPIWAIGTGKTATPQQAQEVHSYIRECLKEKVENPKSIPILYGGSVKPENSYDILSQQDIDGVLVGGASLKVDAFFAIITDSLKVIQG
jgi:triosephosphate isomerase